MTQSLGSRMRRLRLRRGLLLSDVGDATGLSMQYVSNLERDRGNPTLRALKAIATALDTSVADLVGDAIELQGDTWTTGPAFPPSLIAFSRSDKFQNVVEKLSSRQNMDFQEMRQQILEGMATAPRRSSDDPTPEDWQRLLDVYRLILSDLED